MEDKAHAYLIKAPAFLNDARTHISTSFNNNRNSMYSITASISAMEAFLNELVQIGDGLRAHGQFNSIVNMSICIALAEEKRLSIPKKFICAYEGLVGSQFDKGSCRPYQKFLLAIDIRNQLAHPKASVLDISSSGIHAPKSEQKLIAKLNSNGFKVDKKLTYDWESVVNTKAFALWVYQSVLDCMNLIFDSWPYKNAIEPYKKLYSTAYYKPEQWEVLDCL
ncbi:hypothetical protein AKG98_1053 [Moritella sp. JT01]|uniref:hypothetical protein n=1 Tax=Moritella sp. JT01 TaxID=756698 RepID=UPI000795BE1A|nr:hypothetical protein [Moritella sp. JT01]KXO09464.1 hypothetical protein AKG98_1053 [Moritella sp. JT01]